MKAIFEIGKQSGQKSNPSSVSQAMRKAKDNNRERLFTSDEFLTTKQITSFFSRLAAKRNVGKDEEISDDQEADEIQCQSDLQELNDKIYTQSHISIQYAHPIVYDAHNICDLVQKSKLSSFSIAMLQNICEAFGLDTSSIRVRRKKPYVEN